MQRMQRMQRMQQHATDATDATDATNATDATDATYTMYRMSLTLRLELHVAPLVPARWVGGVVEPLEDPIQREDRIVKVERLHRVVNGEAR